jgi:hypothetical protein
MAIRGRAQHLRATLNKIVMNKLNVRPEELTAFDVFGKTLPPKTMASRVIPSSISNLYREYEEARSFRFYRS